MEKVKKENSEAISTLQDKIKVLEKSKDDLESHLNDMEQQTLSNSFLLKGADLTENVAQKSNPNFSPSKSVVSSLLRSKLATNIEESDLKGMKMIKKRDGSLPIYIFQLHSLEKKKELFSNRKLLKGSNSFIEDSLTKYNSSILFEARKLKRAKKIQDCFSIHGCPAIKVGGKIISIKCQQDLSRCSV